MKVKAYLINNGIKTINELAEKPMPVILTAKLLRLLEDLQKENNIIEKQRQLIIEKYADKDENGDLIITEGNVSFKDNIKEVQQELDELANLEIEIPDRKITEQDFIDSKIELTMNQLIRLKNFLYTEE